MYLRAPVGQSIARQGDMGHIGKPQTIIGQKPADGVSREGRAVLEAIAKALFRNGADKTAVNEQAGG